ncbi:MAG: sulfatase-like hydrolase/transferase [Flavobacteriales bacterium]
MHVRSLIARLAVVFVLFTLLRAAFWAFQADAFSGIGAGEVLQVFLQGLRFDAMTIVVANVPFILLHLLPFPGRDRRGYQRALFVLFLAVNVFLLFICCVDLVFYGFNHKRVTSDLLGQAGAGMRNMPLFLVRYWPATLVFVGGIAFLVRGYRWASRTAPPVPMAPRRQWTASLIAVAVLFLAGRGGWQYQGLSPAHAADHVEVANAQLVTNSAFTFGYSLLQPELPPRNYMPQQELDRLMPLGYTLHRDSMDRQMNVVLIIVESLGREYIGALNGGRAFTPFLDSLVERSYVCSNAYANAERSNKSMCALLGGIPSFTDDAFMNTAYAADRVDGWGARLKELGYATSFWHGGLNGEYKFDSFSRACGFDRYYGKDEFGDDALYDGHWGIYDEEFLQFFADGLDREKEPFAATVFTLSSHDPFRIPERYEGRFPKGTQDIHAAIGYVDMALRRFFERARRSPWYGNTLFVLTGDHTFGYNVHPAAYSNAAGRFAVPILFLKGDGSLNGGTGEVVQHLDIGPSILDLVGYEGRINTFGRSVFRNDRQAYAAQYINGQYQRIQAGRLLFFDGTRATGLFDPATDTLFHNDLRAAEPRLTDSLTTLTKAMVQRHAEALRSNTLFPAR